MGQMYCKEKHNNSNDLELFIFITYFSTVVPLTSFLSCIPFVVNATFSTDLVVSSVSSQETEETTKPVENVALTTKGLQERKHNL